MYQNQVTKATEHLLALREDDFRCAILRDVMFSDDIGGVAQDRVFSTEGKEGMKLPKAKPGDAMSYMFVNDQKVIRFSIESNIRNIANLKKSGKVAVKDVWVVLIEEASDGEGLETTAYCNPGASDCDDIIKGKKSVAACVFASSYSIPNPDDKDHPMEYVDWTMISPGDVSKLEEYNDNIIQNECEILKQMFSLDFKTKYIETKTVFLKSIMETK